MSKTKTASYTLQIGRTKAFQRTIFAFKEIDAKDELGTPIKKKVRDESVEPVTMVFEPGQDYQLTPDEIDFLATEIRTGVLVPTNRDPKGRQKTLPADYVPNADEKIAELEGKIESLAAANSELKAANAELKKKLADKK